MNPNMTVADIEPQRESLLQVFPSEAVRDSVGADQGNTGLEAVGPFGYLHSHVGEAADHILVVDDLPDAVARNVLIPGLFDA